MDKFPYTSKNHKTHRFNSFASSTPAVDADRVYSVWGHSKELKVTAHSHSGKLIWEKDLGGVTAVMVLPFHPLFLKICLLSPTIRKKVVVPIMHLIPPQEKLLESSAGSKRLTYSTPVFSLHPKENQN